MKGIAFPLALQWAVLSRVGAWAVLSTLTAYAAWLQLRVVLILIDQAVSLRRAVEELAARVTPNEMGRLFRWLTSDKGKSARRMCAINAKERLGPRRFGNAP